MKYTLSFVIVSLFLMSCENETKIDRYASFQYEVVLEPADSLTSDYLRLRVFSIDGQVADNEHRIDVDTNKVVFASSEIDSVKFGTPITYDIQYFNDSSNVPSVNIKMTFRKNGRVVFTKRYKAGDRLLDFGITHL